MTKKTIYFILLGVTITVALLFMNRPRSVVIDDISVSYPVKPTIEQIPVKVTLTKFQLKKDVRHFGTGTQYDPFEW